jgi:hypothetical protein
MFGILKHFFTSFPYTGRMDMALPDQLLLHVTELKLQLDKLFALVPGFRRKMIDQVNVLDRYSKPGSKSPNWLGACLNNISQLLNDPTISGLRSCQRLQESLQNIQGQRKQ